MPEWNHSLFGCFDDINQLCDTFVFGCCQIGRQCNAVDGRADTHSCLWCVVSLFAAPVMPMGLRCKVSDKYQLGESAVMSCCLGLICPACSLCQTGRELSSRGDPPGGFCCKPKSESIYSPMA